MSLGRWLPRKAARRRWWRAFRSAPRSVQATLVLALGAVLFFAVNWTYQVARKPSELLFPVSGAFYKAPRETWGAYGGLFRRHSTAVLTPDLLAALAQVEGSGNPVVRTYWRWSLTNEPFEIYRPASSAVGMYQITDGTFEEARRYCVHRHVVVEQGPWYDVKSCWFNFLYTRTVPSHAVELTAAYLDRNVADVLERQRITGATLRQKQNLAALMHLCGAGAAAAYVRRGFSFTPGERCGAHDARLYLGRVTAMQRVFAQLASS
ncbi:MAG TPA: lytic transglycosylase domain-containing protein [Gammaproteobacteria bacterium]|nr:lytic transglycosylase domain-containing protein [Gammaproteobacteria bacterium]